MGKNNQFLTAWDNMRKENLTAWKKMQNKQAAQTSTPTNSYAPKPQKATTFDDIYTTISKFDGETSMYDPLYDAVKNLENGGRDYNAVYKAMSDIGGESSMYDPVYDFVKNLENNQPDMGKAETSVTGRPSEMKPTTKPTTPTVSSAVASAMAKLQELRKKTYTDPYGDDLNRMIEEFNNRKAFDYQLNTDQLFLNAREQYVQQGQKAMRDAMGAAATMTGGYGNSYASQVGNQAYQQYLQELNNSIPEFYGSALDRYNAEGQQMLDKINLKDAQRKDDYAMWEAQYLRDLENAALDYDMAVADEQAKNGIVTTTTEDKKEVSLSDAKNQNAALDELTKIAQTKGESAAAAYAAQLVSAGYPEELVNARLQQIDEHGLIPLYDSLIYPDSEEDRKEYPWIVTNVGGGESYAGLLNNNKKVYNKKTDKEYTISELYNLLTEEGYSSAQAKEVLKTVNGMVYTGSDFYVKREGENEEEQKLPISSTSLKKLLNGDWDVANYGGARWGLIDDDAVLIDPETGEKYTHKELYDALARIGYNWGGASAILNHKKYSRNFWNQ